MVVAGDFKNGITFEMDGQVLQVVEFQHVKPGKGAAFVRTKLKNVISGAVVERTFSPTDKFENAYVDRKEMQYLYSDGELYYFMDTETYEQIPLNEDKLPESFKFVKENMLCKIISYKGNVFAVEAPTFVELEVQTPSPAFAAIPLQAPASSLPSRQAQPSVFHSLSTTATFLRSIPAQASILSVHK